LNNGKKSQTGKAKEKPETAQALKGEVMK